MKRILSLSLVLIILFSFAACGGKQTQNGSEPITIQTAANSAQKDKNSDVKIKIPYDLIDEEYKEDLNKFCKAYGY